MSLIGYIRESKAEMKNVQWPSGKTVVVFTALVLGITLALSYFLGGLDVLFAKVLRTIIS